MLREVNILTCIILFSVYFLFDVLYVWFILSVQKLQAVLSSIISATMYIISAIGIIKYTENPWYLFPVVLGASFGTFFFIKHEKKKSKNDIKNNT